MPIQPSHSLTNETRYTEVSSCRVCGNRNLIPIIDLGDQALTGVFPRSASENISHGPLTMVKCDEREGACGLVQLKYSYDGAEMYGENYGYRSSLNASMVAHLRQKVKKLTDIASLQKGDIVLDIGSNDGTLLSFYPDEIVRLVGIDPTSGKFRQFYKPSATVITDFFSKDNFVAAFGAEKAKIVSSIAMFYDLENPLGFIEQIRDILADDGIWHFEQSYLGSMLNVTAYDTICHEHIEYYAFRQIEWMCERAGMRVIDVELNHINGGSFAVTACKRDSSHTPNSSAITEFRKSEANAGLGDLATYDVFRSQVFEHRDHLQGTLADVKAKGLTVLGYGASTKGNVILQFCNLTKDDIPAIAEVNEYKFGRFTPGTKIPIISESEAHAMKPDMFLVLPWHFRANLIAREASYLNAGGKLLFPLPQIEIVGV